jgi:hypothetical protein
VAAKLFSCHSRVYQSEVVLPIITAPVLPTGHKKIPASKYFHIGLHLNSFCVDMTATEN